MEWNSGQRRDIYLGKEEERRKEWDANFIGLVLESRGSCSLFDGSYFSYKAGAQELSFEWEVRVRSGKSVESEEDLK